MTCDLEVRTRGLTYLFDTLKAHGEIFTQESWDIIAKGVLFPIFDDLRDSSAQQSKFGANKEEQSVWLSTTLIQALRQFVDLFSHFLSELSFCVDGLFELLAVCMTQENETLARIGSTCLVQFIENNCEKLNDSLWEKICNTFTHLFKNTTPFALFFDYREQLPQAPAGVVAPPETDEIDMDKMSNSECHESKTLVVNTLHNEQNLSSSLPSSISITHSPATFETVVPDITGRPKPQKKDFQSIILKCVLHLLVIQTVQDILHSASASQSIYESLSTKNAFILIDCLERSYRFAKAFNEDMDLRMALYKMGFMKQLPNLLKQETSSVSTYMSILVKVYSDPSEGRKSYRTEVEGRLLPLCKDIVANYNNLDPDSKRRNVNSWRPVLVIIMNAFVEFDDDQFKTHIPAFYNEFVNILLQEVTSDLRMVLHTILIRAGSSFSISS